MIKSMSDIVYYWSHESQMRDGRAGYSVKNIEFET